MRPHRSVCGSTIGSPELRSASPSLAFASATLCPCLCSQFAADRTVIPVARASLYVVTCARSLVRSRFSYSPYPVVPGQRRVLPSRDTSREHRCWTGIHVAALERAIPAVVPATGRREVSQVSGISFVRFRDGKFALGTPRAWTRVDPRVLKSSSINSRLIRW